MEKEAGKNPDIFHVLLCDIYSMFLRKYISYGVFQIGARDYFCSHCHTGPPPDGVLRGGREARRPDRPLRGDPAPQHPPRRRGTAIAPRPVLRPLTRLPQDPLPNIKPSRELQNLS